MAAGISEGVEKFFVPGQCLEIHQLRAAGIGDIGDVDAALGTAGEVPEQEGVNVAENGVARTGRARGRLLHFRESSES